MNFIVIGAGIGGSAFTRVARGRGHNVTLISEPAPPHSLAATAVLRRAYHKGEEARTWDGSFEYYKHWGIPLASGAQVTSYRTPDKAPHYDKDWHLIDPAAPLLAPDVADQVTSWGTRGTGVVVSTASGGTYSSDCLIMTPGIGTLAPSGKVTWGVTWTHHDPDVLLYPGGLQVHHWAPYKSIVAGPVGGRARLGSSSASTREAAHGQAQHMLAAAWDVGMVNSVKGWSYEIGARLQTHDHIHRVAAWTWWFGGFHRTGYALAPALAAQLITDLEPK